MKYKLMEHIYSNSQNKCLSELRNPDILRYCMKMVESIPVDAFTLEDWKYTYQYITGNKIDADTVEDVKQALKTWTHKIK